MSFSPRTAWFRKIQTLDLAKAFMKTGEISEYLILFFGLILIYNQILKKMKLIDCLNI